MKKALVLSVVALGLGFAIGQGLPRPPEIEVRYGGPAWLATTRQCGDDGQAGPGRGVPTTLTVAGKTSSIGIVEEAGERCLSLRTRHGSVKLSNFDESAYEKLMTADYPTAMEPKVVTDFDGAHAVRADFDYGEFVLRCRFAPDGRLESLRVRSK